VPEDTGGPDDFGYTWQDGVDFGWVNGSVDTGLYDNCQNLAEVPLPFSFKYYENTYTTAYVSYNGWLTFASGSGCYYPSSLPNPGYPNNIVAPWARRFDDYSGAVRYSTGGSAPNRYLAVEWENMGDTCGDAVFTFEAILYESGDVKFQYLDMDYSGGWCCATTGIEDSVGLDGLLYARCSSIPGGEAVLFDRPPPAARVRIVPRYLGGFAQPGVDEVFDLTIRNTGELGSDTYDLTVISAWAVALFEGDGVTPLADSDSDGVPDTGLVPQGSSVEIVVRVAVPGGSASGDHDTVLLTARSSVNPDVGKTATLQAAVPAPFAQVYTDQADGAMSLRLAQPAGDILRKAAPDWTYGYDPAVAETADGFVYVWSEGQQYGGPWVDELWYALFDRYGQPLRAPERLTDLSGADVYTYDSYPAVAATTDGRAGVLWYRYSYDSDTDEYNYNIWFAILDPSVGVVYGPLNVTNNSDWGDWGDYWWPSFYNPTVAGTSDNRYVMAWSREYTAAPGGGCSDSCYVDDIFYAVRSSSGISVKPVTQFTFDTPGYQDGHSGANLAALNGSRVLLSWERTSDDDIHYAVLDSGGYVVKGETNLTDDGYSSYDYNPDAVQLSGGRTLVAWTGGQYPSYTVRYALLDSAYNRVFGPVALDNPAAFSGNDYVSVAADASNHGILTWSDYDYYSRTHLFYALVDAYGGVATPPMLFHSSPTSSRVYTSYSGYGNTSWSWAAAEEVDGYAAFGATAGGPPGGAAMLQLEYANHGGTTAQDVQLVATLESELTYLWDTSGVTPLIVGDEVTWDLPDQGFLEEGSFLLYVGLPSGAGYGTLYTVGLEYWSAGPEANPGDNTDSAQVMVARQIFLPLGLRVR